MFWLNLRTCVCASVSEHAVFWAHAEPVPSGEA
jgi:hypothetical protein